MRERNPDINISIKQICTWHDISKINLDFHLLALYKVECKYTRNQIKYVTLMKYVCGRLPKHRTTHSAKTICQNSW